MTLSSGFSVALAPFMRRLRATTAIRLLEAGASLGPQGRSIGYTIQEPARHLTPVLSRMLVIDRCRHEYHECHGLALLRVLGRP